jgi:hypothetical protein
MAPATLRVGPIITLAEREQWDALAGRSPVGHRHQCRWWMDPLQPYGFEVRVLACWVGERLVGGALFRSYSIPMARVTMTECLDGPIFLDWDSAWADEFIVAIIGMADDVGSLAVTIKDCPHAEVHRNILAALDRRGLTLETAPAPADAILPLAGRSLEQIRQGFNHGTRRRLKKAERGGLQVRRLVRSEDLFQAYQAWIATATRKSFTDVRPWAGLEPVLRHSIDNRHGSVLASFIDDRLLAAAFIAHVGTTAAYVYGGYRDGAEKHSPNHILQYEAIRESMELGLSTYNFGNLISEGQPAARGVDDFKLGFGAEPRRHLDTITWKRKPLLHAAIERMRQASIGRELENLLRDKLIRRGNARRLEERRGLVGASLDRGQS